MSKRRDRGSELEAFTNDLAPPVRRGKGLDGMIGAAPPAPVERGDDTALSPSETDALTHCEAVIERGLKTFFEVGNALLRIRELELYRIEYRTFEAYCAERWGISRPRAYELMNASQVVSAIADKSTEPADFQLPQNEAQARPLTRLKDTAQQREAWNRAVQRAGGDRITARLVDQAVSEILAELAPARVEIIDQEVADAASPAMSPDAHGEPADDAADPDDEHDPVAHIQTELTMTRDERDRLVELSDRLFALLDSYQEQITRAQNYKPTSDRGEAVSPLLRLIEQIYLTLIESEPDDTSGGERGKHTSR